MTPVPQEACLEEAQSCEDSFEQAASKKWVFPVAAIAFLVVMGIAVFMVFGSLNPCGTWHQSNSYYNYDAVMQLDSSSCSITTDEGGKWSGDASVSGGSIIIGGYTYELQDGGQKLVCVSNKGTSMLAGEWYRSESAAAAHPRKN